jgi:VanZ family protein
LKNYEQKTHSKTIRLTSLSIAISAVAAIFILGRIKPITEKISLHPPLDKIEHFVVYGTIALLFRIGTIKPYTWLIGALVIAFGMLDEYQQSFLPFRESSLSDLLADTLGILTFLVSYKRFYRQKFKI